MQAGKLDRRVTLFRFGTTYDEFNQPTESWTEIGKRWASKSDASDGEKLRAAQVGASVTTRFQMRFDSLTRTLTAADQIECEGIRYAISGVKETEGRREGIEVTAARPNDNLVPVAP